uniref:Matrix metalloprotease 2 n=1 Tax=Chlamydomonas reinhardtii TaxID=3055 RepID=Q93VQ1_CHLRE|nr:matrix metalloprotease 2 [Chlamydomonas reinhardtii]BAB68385.1 matrix metalloprotease 2 [Chlamydomonas reinhardtii]
MVPRGAVRGVLLAILAMQLLSSKATTITGIGMIRYMEGAQAEVRHPPPLRRRPPPTRGRQQSPPGSGGAVLDTVTTPPQLQLVCPQIIDIVTGYPMDDPSCYVPRVVLAQGEAAEQMRNENGVSSGDIMNVTLDVSANGSFAVTSLKTVMLGSQKGGCKCIYSGTPADDRVVMYLLDFSSCQGYGMAAPAALTPEVAWRLLSQDGSSAPGSSFKAYQETCSYGRRLLNPDNVVVVGPCRCPALAPSPTSGRARTLVGISPAAANALRMNSTHIGWWDLSRSCTPAEMSAVERAAEAFAQQIVAKDPNSADGRKLQAILQWRERRRNIYVLPPGSSCAHSWPAIAESLCTSATCGVFVDSSTLLPNAAAPRPPHILMHEMLHVLGLTHAGRGLKEAGDPTDIMGTFGGAGRGLLCPNAPNMYRIGWAKPINEPGLAPFQMTATGVWGNLTAANFTNTNWIRGLIIPAQGTRDDNMIVVNVGARSTQVGAETATGAQAYYFSYRIKNTTAGGYDSGLTSDFHKKVVVHAFNGIQSERVFGFKPSLLDWGPNFQSKSEPVFQNDDGTSGCHGGHLDFTLPGGYQRSGRWREAGVQSTSDTQAVVDICRITENGKELSCDDGVDNDCNGLQDTEDPDCQ